MASILWGMTASTLALSQSQIIEKLRRVPVFTVANDKGSPLLASGDNNNRMMGVFMSQKDAKEFVNKLKKEKPKLAQKVQVVALPLGRVYKIDQQNEGKSKDFDLNYVPMEQEVQSALSVLKKQGKKAEDFQGVPLFFARGQQNQGFLTVKRGKNSEKVIPMFFEKEQLQQMINKLKENQPQKAKSVTIDVTSLQSVLQSLEEKNNEQLKQVILVPSQDSLQSLQQNSQSNSQQQN
ncbi:MAG: Tic22 family protein [Halothece sp.]